MTSWEAVAQWVNKCLKLNNQIIIMGVKMTSLQPAHNHDCNYAISTPDPESHIHSQRFILPAYYHGHFHCQPERLTSPVPPLDFLETLPPRTAGSIPYFCLHWWCGPCTCLPRADHTLPFHEMLTRLDDSLQRKIRMFLPFCVCFSMKLNY
jgi:hypothetical protein